MQPVQTANYVDRIQRLTPQSAEELYGIGQSHSTKSQPNLKVQYQHQKAASNYP